MALEAGSTHTHPDGDITRPNLSFRALESCSDTLIATLLIVGALILFFIRLDQPTVYIYDEVYHGFTAAELAKGNYDAYRWDTQKPPGAAPTTAYEWSHPAFAKLPMQLSVLMWGDNAFGWRFMEAIWGALGIGLMYALGRVLFDRTIGVIGAGLLLFEGLWFVQSRTAMNDVYLVTWIMLAYLLFAVYLRIESRQRWRWLLAAGTAIGLGVATKWSALYSYGLLGLVATLREGWLARTRPRDLPLSLVALFGAFIVLPFLMYIGSYIQFFAVGNSLADWRELQRQMWVYHSGLKATHDWASRWWTWPLMIRPVWYHVGYTSDATIANTFAMGNPVVWWAFLPAMFYALHEWYTDHARLVGLSLTLLGFLGYLLLWMFVPALPLAYRGLTFLPAVGYAAWQTLQGRNRSIGLGLILLGFFGQWLPWYISPRISFFYHMLPSVPFGCLGIAYALQHLRLPRRAVLGYLALVVLGFAFFYPHLSALSVPKWYSNLEYWLPTWVPNEQGWWQ
jgi:dolichyl-phosphate-mannose--protein O-mannosyl transferase